MMQRLLGTIFGLGVGLAGGAWAQSSPAVVVELFTSQGCSACPPADVLLETLADDPRVIALSLHVDYWDYIGWTDEFGQAAFTARQKSYAKAAGSRMLYTPQFIIAGTERVEGNQPDRLQALLTDHTSAASPPDLDLTRDGDMLHITARPATLPEGAEVQLVRYHPEMTVDIKRGENAGRSITYSNIVTSWELVGKWAGDAPLDLSARAEGADAVVVILQTPGPGPIIAAERLN